MGEPSVKRLGSGYWLVRWNQNRWIQWPCGRDATMADAFGDVTPAMLEQARAALARAREGEKHG